MINDNNALYTIDDFLGGFVKLKQPQKGCRATSDAVILSSFISPIASGDVLDMGSGTGIISIITAKKAINTHVTGIEIQQDLITLANENAILNKVEDRIEFIHCDITKPATFALKNKNFDAVITNPPFYDEVSCNDSPISKNIAHHYQSGLLEMWLDFATKRLKPKGKLFILHKADKLSDILYILNDRLGSIQIYPLYSSAGKPASRIIITGVKASKTPLKIMPPLIVHNEDGSFTDEAEKLLRRE